MKKDALERKSLNDNSKEIKMRRVGKRHRKLNHWYIKNPLYQLLDYLEESHKLTAVYSTGILRLRGAHQIALAAAKVKEIIGVGEVGKGASREEHEQRFKREKEIALLAAEEVSSGFR
jgi:hypothetical protein